MYHRWEYVDKGARVAKTIWSMNPDGSRAFCGNGTRCAARFAVLAGLAGERMTLDTEAGAVPATRIAIA